VKRSTAIGHLVELASESADMVRLQSAELRWPLTELWVTGELLTDAPTLEWASVVLVLDLPGEDVPWLALNPAGEWVGDRLRLGKRPLLWCYRPAVWPVWNHEHRRLVRYWSAGDGLDETVIDALRERQFDGLTIVEPTPTLLAEQLREEIAVSRRHLRATLDHYWDRDWRGEHKGFGVGPEDHLWRAAQAVTEMTDALDSLTH
jgi:hypothetical protein